MEIERKYLVKTLPDLTSYPSKKITQAYISTKPVIRLRQMGDEFFLTVKSKGHLIREEFEMPITQDEYEHLYKKVEGHPIEKTRYYISIDDNLTAELDLYHDFLDGLLTVEVEFNDEEAAHNFIPPTWFGDDITFDASYKNNQLALNGNPQIM